MQRGGSPRTEGGRVGQDGSSACKQNGPRPIGEQSPPYRNRWSGCAAVCIASGPSLTRSDCALIAAWKAASPETRKVIAVNNSHELAPWADVVFAFDRKWWLVYGECIKEGPELWTSNREVAKVLGLHHVRGEMGGGMPYGKDSIKLGRNSGFQAVQLALFFGAARVVLTGYDMQRTHGLSHWHGDHKSALLGNPVASKFRYWHADFAAMPDDVRARVTNATRQTALTCFTRADLHDCLVES